MAAKTNTKQEKVMPSGTFHRVFLRDDGKLTTGVVVITGAINTWKTRPDFIYLPKYQLAGFPADVVAYLVKTANLSEEDAKEAVEIGAITKDNFEGDMAEEYNKLVDDHNNGRKEKGKSSSGKAQVVELGELLDTLSKKDAANPQAEPKAKGKKAAASTTTSSRPKNLYLRYKNLTEDSVLDASFAQMSESGNPVNIKTQTKPKNADKSSKVGVDSVPGVVSSNAAGYKLAMEALAALTQDEDEKETFISAISEWSARPAAEKKAPAAKAKAEEKEEAPAEPKAKASRASPARVEPETKRSPPRVQTRASPKEVAPEPVPEEKPEPVVIRPATTSFKFRGGRR